MCIWGISPNTFENDCRSKFSLYSLQLFFVVLSIPWLISTIFFSIFDTKCIVFEQASVINCSQGFFIANPRHWVFAWLLMSIISSLLLIFIVFFNRKKINYQTEKAKKIWRKGYVGSFIFLLLTSLVYYIIRIYSTRSEKTSVSISILVFLWPPVIVLVICCLNYLPRPHWTKTSLPRYTLEWCKDCLSKNSNFFIYWLALVVYFVEITCKAGATMLDVAHDVAPLIQNKFPDESGQFRGVMVVVIGFRLAFHIRVLSFFWQKLFHGEKDLFSEPHTNLVEEPSVQKQCNELVKTAHLDEIICT